MLHASLRSTTVTARAILSGLGVTLAGTVPWAILAWLSLRYFVQVPWAAVVMGIYLYFFWQILCGKWPRSASSQTRHELLRARPLSAEVWGAALFAGMMGLIALMPLMAVLARLVDVPDQAAEAIVTPEGMPALTAFVLVLMSSLVAGMVEEAAFRGYMQGPLERRFGPVIGIVLTGIVFGVVHYNHHPDHVLNLLPYYLTVSALWGTLAYLTKSILPGLALHALGDVWVITRQWLTGTPGWKAGSESTHLVWETGIDASFIGALLGLVVFGTIATFAFRALAEAVKAEPAYKLEYES